MYIEAVERYINEAKSHASNHKFSLVTIKEEMQIITLSEHHNDSCVFHSGIGEGHISDAKRFEEFLNMVKEGNKLERFLSDIREIKGVLK